MTVKDYQREHPQKSGARFLARWIASMVELGIPKDDRIGENKAEAPTVEKYRHRLFVRFALYSIEDFYAAWDEVVIDRMRRQAETESFPTWNFGILEAGLVKFLKGKQIDSSRLLAQPKPNPEEERRKAEINDLFENPTTKFAIMKAREMAGHLEGGLRFMLIGQHLVNVFAKLEEMQSKEWIEAAKRAARFTDDPLVEYRKRLISETLKTQTKRK